MQQTAATQTPGQPRFLMLWDGGLAYRAIVGEITPANRLLRLVASRIRAAAQHLQLSNQDLHRIFDRHSVFEAEMQVEVNGRAADFILVETYHLLQGMVGKGALKLIFPQSLVEEADHFRLLPSGAIEVLPLPPATRWSAAADAEVLVKQAMREFMTGETLSMSLKSQATGAPFAGSEGLVLCALREFDAAAGRYYLKPVLRAGEDHGPEEKELIELMMNESAEILTRAGRIGFDKIVHAAETNSTLTARLDLQLPANVVEGHLRTLLRQDPAIIIGDDDMTAKLRELLDQPDYFPTRCTLVRAAAQMQMDHSVLLSSSREKLRHALAQLPESGSPTPAQYREIIDLFFGAGESRQLEDQLYHRREPVLRQLSVALSARSLDDCGEPEGLAFYLKTLLDNQRTMLQTALLKRLPASQPLPLDWFSCAPLLSADQARRLAALMPFPGITRDKVKENFWEIVNILCEAKAELPRYTPDPHLQARKEVLERAIRAITSAGDVLPSSERIVFFLLPFSYECVTPKLGVVTRKPVALCGSELRPEGMAVGGVMSIEILLKQLTRKTNPLAGLTVAIEGLGNAGKHVATTMMQKGAVITGLSDSTGAVVCEDGFTREELAVIIAHKNSGKRLGTLFASPAARGFATREGPPITFFPEPGRLHSVKADILVLAAIPGTIHEANSPTLDVRIVCELTGAAITCEAKRILSDRQVHVIPDNLASSGGLLVSLSEMLQNSAGQNWDRKLEEDNLYRQLSRSYSAVLGLGRKHHVDAPTASDILALQRMHHLALYREQLESLSGQLGHLIRGIPANQRVLIASDDDEDGVASAAILHTLIARLNPPVTPGISCLNSSFRSNAILDRVLEAETSSAPIRHVFVLDRAFPVREAEQARLAELARRCRVVFINNHMLPAELLLDPLPPAAAGGFRPRTPAALDLLFISPQTLRSSGPARHFSTALILRSLASQLIHDEAALAPINWQAAVGSCLDAPHEPGSEWLWFFTQFNPDRTLEAAQAIRLVTRTGGFLNAVHALTAVTNPEQLETHPAWQQFLTEFRLLEERIEVLVEKIVLENRGRPYTSHFFAQNEVSSPTPVTGNDANELDLYLWISEQLTLRGNLADKPIIVGQVVRVPEGQSRLGVRIRSPRGVDLTQAGLPEPFRSGGIPNTAVGHFPLSPDTPPEQQFHELVGQIWTKTAPLEKSEA